MTWALIILAGVVFWSLLWVAWQIATAPEYPQSYDRNTKKN